MSGSTWEKIFIQTNIPSVALASRMSMKELSRHKVIILTNTLECCTKCGSGEPVWILWEHCLYGFLVGFVAVVTVVFVVIKGIWIMAAVSRGEANKMELRRPLTCSRSSLRLTSFMLFMTFCCSSLLLAHEFSVHLFWFGLCCCSYWIKSVSAS